MAVSVPAVADRTGVLGAVTAFWSAYVLTRPLGSSIADWMAAPHAHGGLGWGVGPVTLSWTPAILGFVGCLMVSRRDSVAPGAGRP
ncbi:hypothetical protein ACIPPM_18925 [Streptomyces sp. NPDC090119]|uniref:hypothetical protein n=1 Tax=Streptomyces sp. NPDC090119 TaxID=3365951 RepID=UPI0037F6A6FF